MDRSEGDFSVFASNTLDAIGYSSIMIKFRREQMTCIYDRISRNFEGVKFFSCLLSGSKGEGNSRIRESDFDFMSVTTDIICVEDIAQYDTHNDTQRLIQLDMRNTAPGYTLLSPLEDDPGCIMSNEGIDYIPNDIGRKSIPDEFDIDIERHGPAECIQGLNGIPGDIVLAFGCHCPSILTPWLRRQRQHDWPSRQILQDISVLEAHVVPVGFKRSYEQYLEWRICFTQAELMLVISFNDTQMKVFILLKLLAKSSLKPVCGEMTSYGMKNIVLWLSELSQLSMFRAERLIECLVRFFRLLSICIVRGVLPSYMIPQRNLFSGNIRPGEKKTLLSVLSDLMNEGGGNMLLQSDKMKDAMLKMNKTPDAAKAEGEKLDKFETLIFLHDYCVTCNVKLKVTIRRVREIIEIALQEAFQNEQEIELILYQQIWEHILPDELSLRSRGKNLQNVFRNRYNKPLLQLS